MNRPVVLGSATAAGCPGGGTIGLAVRDPQRPPSILVLEDQPEIQALVSAMVRARRLSCAVVGTLGDARSRLAAGGIDIVIADVRVPDGSGLSLVGRQRADTPLVVIMTGKVDIDTAVEAIRRGAIDFLPKPFAVSEFLAVLDRAVETWRTRTGYADYGRALETLIRIRSDELSRTSRTVDQIQDTTVSALAAALGLKDLETADHASRVSRNSEALGRLLELSELELRSLRWGACLHDVGKIGIPERILLKPQELTPEERTVMQMHPMLGSRMVHNIEFLRPANDVVEFHHERYDGTGYPHGFAGENIPLNARIFAVMDTLDAMTSDRPYRSALPVEAAVVEIELKRGSQFDPEIVDRFLAAPATTWLVQGRRPRKD